jgi:hypothetical protein
MGGVKSGVQQRTYDYGPGDVVANEGRRRMSESRDVSIF